ncbi:MAG: cbb3-type cytochrome c oxidase subunit II [Actinobacteria bacterium]|nr:cbb3-type cytochrome c oxidase subunit II [Actinomycetota bacterium]
MKDGRPAMVAAGAIAAFFVGFIVTYALPMTDPALTAVTRHSIAYGEETERGKAVYDREGCVFCHTQQVRPVKADVGLGRATRPDRYSKDSRSVIGLARIGPDLACVGERFQDAGAIRAYLSQPIEQRPYSKMPSLTYLSAGELEDLSAYLASLTCGDG